MDPNTPDRPEEYFPEVDEMETVPENEGRPKYCALIPVFNGESVVGETVDRTVAFFDGHGFDYELVLVDDGSTDGSWEVLQQKASDNPRILVIRLLRNYGQTNALLCGLRNSTADFVITLDDDLQNPPEEIMPLIEKINEGYDVVFGSFRVKHHPLVRRLGSGIIGMINRRIFHQPKNLTVSNFRILRRDVVDRICRCRTSYAYVTGLALLCARHPADVVVKHRPSALSNSRYTLSRLLNFTLTILIGYTSYPMRLCAVIGGAVAVLSFLFGSYIFVRTLLFGTVAPGWPSLVVLLSFFNGVMILMLGLLGEYVSRILNEITNRVPYQIVERVGGKH